MRFTSSQWCGGHRHHDPATTEMGMKQLQDWSVSLANPLNWNRPRKWMITLTSCYMSSLISIAASAYSIGTDQMITDLHSSRLLVISGISFFTLAIAIFPLFLSPLGEEVGRRYVYLVSYAIFFSKSSRILSGKWCERLILW
jgi:hypothetical protein